MRIRRFLVAAGAGIPSYVRQLRVVGIYYIELGASLRRGDLPGLKNVRNHIVFDMQFIRNHILQSVKQLVY